MRALGGTQREALRERKRVTRALGGMLPPPPTSWSEEQRALDSFRKTRRLEDLAYFHIASPRVMPRTGPQPVESELIPDDVACLRTDLDGFGDIEIAALVNHGYDMADRYVRRYMTALGDAKIWNKPPSVPKPLAVEKERVEQVLLAGRSRFFRALKLRSLISWPVTVAIVAAIVWLVYRSGVSLGGALESAVRAPVGFVTGFIDDIVWGVTWALHRIMPMIPEIRTPPASDRPRLLAWLVGIVGVVFLILMARRPRKRLRTGKTASVVRFLVTTRKRARAVSGNLLWFAWGLPAIVAVATSALAAVSYVFYHLPFMRATRARTRGRV
jgi:hypothetical protein